MRCRDVVSWSNNVVCHSPTAGTCITCTIRWHRVIWHHMGQDDKLSCLILLTNHHQMIGHISLVWLPRKQQISVTGLRPLPLKCVCPGVAIVTVYTCDVGV